MISILIRLFAALAGIAILFVLVVLRTRERGPGPQQLAGTPGAKMLIFSKTAGYRHGCIPDGNGMLAELAGELDLVPFVTEDAAVFSAGSLDSVRLIVFNNTTGDVLNAEQEAAFETWFCAGGAFAGIHAATDTEYGWKFYGEIIGAHFKKHPKIQEATLRVVTADHPATAHLPAEWVRKDEWYDFKEAPPAETTQFLLKLDEATYKGGSMGADHPISWSREIHGGRAWYTGLGHTKESYAEPAFRQHVKGGLRWALRK